MVNKIKDLLETVNELTSPEEKIRVLTEILKRFYNEFEEHDQLKPELAHGEEEIWEEEPS